MATTAGRRAEVRRGIVRGLVAGILLVEVALPLLLFVLRDRLIFFPKGSPLPGDAVALSGFGRGVEARVVAVRRADGRSIEALDARPAPGGPDGDAGALPVVLFLHGNACVVGEMTPRAGVLVRSAGVRVLMTEYTGYGGNAGRPSETEVIADALAAFDHLIAEGVAPGRIVLYGESLGGAVAAAVAERRACAGVVVQSSFSSLSSMARRLYPWMPLTALLVRRRFPSTERLAAATGPVLVVHGTRDTIIPMEEGRALAAALGTRAEFHAVEGAGHNDLWVAGGDDWLRLLKERIHDWTAPVEPPAPR